MAWLIPFSSLIPAQQDAVQMDTRSHKAIIGGPGAGKTLVLLHRLNLLFHRAGKNHDAVRLFVYTNTLKQFIQAGNDMLDVPDACISTFDKWCADTYRTQVNPRLPTKDKKPDFEAIRSGIFGVIESGKLPTPLFDSVLIDEAQDMDIGAIEILKRLARHITICMDGKQQLYDDRMSEPEALSRLGLSRHNTALLAAFRCNPMVTELAAQFIADDARRQEFMRQASNLEMDRSRPLFYVADNFFDEAAHLIEMVKLRLSYGDSIAVLFPKQSQVHGFAKRFMEAGVDVKVQERDMPIDFSNPFPKLMTYHQAKGLSFDSVFMPRLNQSSFPGEMSKRIGHMCFVGVSRAVKWVYMSGNKQALIAPMQELGQVSARRFLESKISGEAAGLLGLDVVADNPVLATDPFGLD
ncbi:MAG: 3'-5' exonuclease [Rhodoferax sp.]